MVLQQSSVCPACQAPYAYYLYAPGQCLDASCGDRTRRHTHRKCDNAQCVGQSEWLDDELGPY